MKKQKVLVILGPTSSGKTALSIVLARKFKGEAISADSRQVYIGLNIGTGKVTKTEMQNVRHHLLDVCSPKKKFSADDFAGKARAAIAAIAARAHLPIVVGGTGFYIDALTGRIILPNVPPNDALRAKLEKKTCEQLFALLEKKDPQRSATIERDHQRRLIRALEIAHALGTSPTPTTELPYDVLWIGIAPPLDELNEKIHRRLLARMRIGMIAEAKRLHAQGLSYKRMEELGLEYRALARHLKGITSKDEMITELESDIKRYAKKQLAYWKRNDEITWFTSKDTAKIEKAVSQWVKH